MKIEIDFKQFKAMNTVTILAAQHAPPYTREEIAIAAKAAEDILWKVKYS